MPADTSSGPTGNPLRFSALVCPMAPHTTPTKTHCHSDARAKRDRRNLLSAWDLKRCGYPSRTATQPSSALSSHAQSRDLMPVDIQQCPSGSPLISPCSAVWPRAPRRLKNFVIPTRERSETGGIWFLPVIRNAADTPAALQRKPLPLCHPVRMLEFDRFSVGARLDPALQ
jgi:hypothetical protein